jgi:hypothetical protein
VEACKVGALKFGEINELVKAARTRYTERTLQAIGTEAVAVETLHLPVPIETWRRWGSAVSTLNSNGGKKGA